MAVGKFAEICPKTTNMTVSRSQIPFQGGVLHCKGKAAQSDTAFQYGQGQPKRHHNLHLQSKVGMADLTTHAGGKV